MLLLQSVWAVVECLFLKKQKIIVQKTFIVKQIKNKKERRKEKKRKKNSELRNISSLASQERSQRVQKNYKPRQESGWVYPL